MEKLNNNPARISIVLDLINWSDFITSNTHIKEDSEILPKLIQHIVSNMGSIRKIWLKNPTERLGKLLIQEQYLPNYAKLALCDESDWLIENGYCTYEEIHFWGRTRDERGNKLPETKYILLKDITDAHVSAIIDWCDEHNIKLHGKYKDYFNKRINELKNKKDASKNK